MPDKKDNGTTIKFVIVAMWSNFSAQSPDITPTEARMNEDKKAKRISEILLNKEYEISKLSTENKELYGSVKPTEISKILLDKEKVEINPAYIQPVKEIKSIGKFKVKVSLHSEVEAEIIIIVNSAETIQ